MLSLNEIRHRSYQFISRQQQQTLSEESFWPEFLQLFGVKRRRIQNLIGLAASNPVLLWKGKILLELCPKSEVLESQLDPIEVLCSSLREREIPHQHLLSDGEQFLLKDLQSNQQWTFTLDELPQQTGLFGILSGYDARDFAEQDPINLQAAEKLGVLHDLLKRSDYSGQPLELYLIRLLFCLFADDTGIFATDSFHELIENNTEKDGSDLAGCLNSLFSVLANEQLENDTATSWREEFPYIGSNLFTEQLPEPACSSEIREALLDCCALDWRRISPAVFGSLFQAVMEPQARRDMGAHYTSETNILKALQPLFLDELKAELDNILRSRSKRQHKLVAFQQKLAAIRLLDPACGCGNFLVIAYRELRLLEIEVLQALYGEHSESGQIQLDVATLIQVDVDQMLGIELETFPCLIAQVALWLTDHQINQRVSDQFGQLFLRLPLRKSANIVQGNALQLNWSELFNGDKLNYIVGNPPFAGAKYMDGRKKAELNELFTGVKAAGLLDYVTGWYRKAVDTMQSNPAVKSAFVSTNSITQGEQVSVLWQHLLAVGTQINFAHRTFQWEAEGRGKAAVHCVIIGFALQADKQRWLYEYDHLKAQARQIKVKHINPYLVDANDTLLSNRSTPLCHVPPIGIGNKPIDGGHYLFTPEEKAAFLSLEPAAAPLFKRWIGSREFINNQERWCLWLGDCSDAELEQLPHCRARIEAVRAFRMTSKSAPTQKLADKPTRFHVENMPEGYSLIIPEVSSERRHYLPVGFIGPDVLASNLVKMVPNAGLYEFAIITSQMHMAWMRAVCGRLKSDYRYSVTIVYNNFPWPDVSNSQKRKIIKMAQQLLDCRQQFPDKSLAELYDPQKMPTELMEVHQRLDKAVDGAYSRLRFESEAQRLSFLFERYRQLTEH